MWLSFTFFQTFRNNFWKLLKITPLSFTSSSLSPHSLLNIRMYLNYKIIPTFLFPSTSLRLWLKCNQLLTLGRPVGAVTLSRWEWWWNERWIWGVRGALNLISTNYPDHVHHGLLPLSRKNAHGRARNRTRDLMVSSQKFWPPSHEARHIPINYK